VFVGKPFTVDEYRSQSSLFDLRDARRSVCATNFLSVAQRKIDRHRRATAMPRPASSRNRHIAATGRAIRGLFTSAGTLTN
jgi:hypothetical protein